jgi:hypothetical protein
MTRRVTRFSCTKVGWTWQFPAEMRSISAILNGGPVHWLRDQRSALVGSYQLV